jgi:protein-disulfide isomerase
MLRLACGVFVICLCGCVSRGELSKARSIQDVSGPAVEISPKEISLGLIPAQQVEIKGVIPVFNSGTETLEIKKVSGQCACFKGYAGDKRIGPGQGGEIEVRFDPLQIPAGKAKRVVRIETNDPSRPVSEVYLAFDIQRSGEQEQNRILHTEIAQLRSEVKTLRKDVEKLKKQSGLSPQKAQVEDTQIHEIPVGDSPVLGSEDAMVTIVEFSDFQCPYCIKEYAILKQIIVEYPGKVRLVFKHFPLDFHKQASAIHAMMELTLRQKGNVAFWKLYEMIQAESKKLEPAVLKGYAQVLELDVAELDKLWADEKAMAELLKADKELAAKCNVHGTPTIFVNGVKLANRSLEDYRSRIKRILSSQGNIISRAK